MRRDVIADVEQALDGELETPLGQQIGLRVGHELLSGHAAEFVEQGRVVIHLLEQFPNKDSVPHAVKPSRARSSAV